MKAKNEHDPQRGRSGFGFEPSGRTTDGEMALRVPMQIARELRDRAAMKELGRRIAYGLADERRVDAMTREGLTADEILTALDRALAAF